MHIAIAKVRGSVQAAYDVGLTSRTIARARDDQALTRFVRGALLEAHQAGPPTKTRRKTGETAEGLARRVEATEAQLADALGRERERADALERRLELVEERQAGEPGSEQPVGEPSRRPGRTGPA